jgi:hypothetical protein
MVRIGSPLHASEVARVRTNIAFALGSLGDERARDPSPGYSTTTTTAVIWRQFPLPAAPEAIEPLWRPLNDRDAAIHDAAREAKALLEHLLHAAQGSKVRPR